MTDLLFLYGRYEWDKLECSITVIMCILVFNVYEYGSQAGAVIKVIMSEWKGT